MKDIKNYEGKYAITENGQVWSYLSNQFLKPYKRKINENYLTVELQGKAYQVHRLVAETFIPNPENKPTVDHIDRNPENNSVSNLKWATYKEQATNKNEVILNNYSNHLKNNGSCQEKSVIMCDKNTHIPIKQFSSMTEAAIFLGKKDARKNISAVCRGKRLSTYGYYWQYA